MIFQLSKSVMQSNKLLSQINHRRSRKLGLQNSKKIVLKKGDKQNFPKKGDKVSCYYVGKLTDGTVFDSLQPGSKKKRIQALSFNVGKNHVIRGVSIITV
uniref:peptidylprolyl isomerase n=1 Tax=Phallusia mammillata TaxID=59560 RepID=A0A6F9DD34_9ASCI|nr:peptidyl-prolyl cis-trans isomerase FKBP3-like [Phallusia mammillata]